MADEKEPNKPKNNQPKPTPVLTDSDIEKTGEKGSYNFFVFGLDQKKKPMSEQQILVFFGKELQPRLRLATNAHAAVEFPINITKDTTIGIKIGNLPKQTFDLEGPEQASSGVSDEEKTMGWWKFTVKHFSKALEKLRSKK